MFKLLSEGMDDSNGKFAEKLDSIDRGFVKTLRMVDFFNHANNGGQDGFWKANFKIIKYVEYQKALYQMLRGFVINKHHIIEEQKDLASPKGSIHTSQEQLIETQNAWVLGKSFAIQKLI